MPEISRFYGIIIAMYYREHPPPHFHAKHADKKAVFSIADLKMIEGQLPKRSVRLILKWASEHQETLLENWERARQEIPLHKIPPLD